MFYGMHLVASHVFSASRIIIRINKYISFRARSKCERILGSISQLLHINIGKCRYKCAGDIDLSIKPSASRIKRKTKIIDRTFLELIVGPFVLTTDGSRAVRKKKTRFFILGAINRVHISREL